jgi:hypothetical protein
MPDEAKPSNEAINPTEPRTLAEGILMANARDKATGQQKSWEERETKFYFPWEKLMLFFSKKE